MRMIRYLLCAALLAMTFAHGFSQKSKIIFPKSFEVTVTNPIGVVRQDVPLLISELPGDFNGKAFIVLDNGTEIPSQYNLSDIDKGIFVVLNSLKANEKRTLMVRHNVQGTNPRNYPKRTQAELSHKVDGAWKEREYIGGNFKNVDYLRVPKEHKDHSWFIRYEGPGWESDKVGYRFYLDQRNATDVFGKVAPEMALQKTGLDGFDSYHNLQDWGMDVLKVGKSLGVGTIGSLVNGAAVRVEKTDSVDCRITANGPVYSSIMTNYYGWQVGSGKYNLKSLISIHAGTRLTREQIWIDGDIPNICTGLVKDEKGKVLTSNGDAGHYGYLASWGPQSLNSDDLGIAVLFKASDRMESTADKESHIVTLKPSGGKVEYYFLGAWSKEPEGIRDEKQFTDYLDAVARELANPIQVVVTKK